MNYALIFAGGVGRRMNSRAKPKQFLEIHGKPILIHTLEHFEMHPAIDAICLVIVADWLDYTRQLTERFGITKLRWIVPGGASAMESQRIGLETIRAAEGSSPDDIVLIHDGVRPLINATLISDCIESVKAQGSAITVAPATETILRADENGELDSIPRSECLLARAPQAFPLQTILNAHRRAQEEGKSDFIDSVTLMLHYDYPLHTVEGPAENLKVTTPADFYVCRALLDARENSQLYGL